MGSGRNKNLNRATADLRKQAEDSLRVGGVTAEVHLPQNHEETLKLLHERQVHIEKNMSGRLRVCNAGNGVEFRIEVAHDNK